MDFRAELTKYGYNKGNSIDVETLVDEILPDLFSKQEQMYSEEDLEKSYKDGGRNEYDFINKYHCKARISFDKWFEQFKNK